VFMRRHGNLQVHKIDYISCNKVDFVHLRTTQRENTTGAKENMTSRKEAMTLKDIA
jgi:hypothetical protein